MPIDDIILQNLRAGKISHLELSMNTADENAISLTDDDVRLIADACADNNSLTLIDLSCNDALTDAAITHLSRIKSLQEILLTSLKITDACLPLFVNFKKLYKVTLGSCFDITEDGYLTFINTCPNLVHLYLNPLEMPSTRIATALAQLRELKTLRLANTPCIKANFFEELIKSQSIRNLDIRYCMLRDENIKPLARSSKITKVSIDNNSITDDGIKTLCQMVNLEWLSASGNQITDQGLFILANCKKIMFCELDKQKNKLGYGIVHSPKILAEIQNLTSRNELIHKGQVATLETRFIENLVVIAQGARQLTSHWSLLPVEVIVNILCQASEIDWRTKPNIANTIILAVTNLRGSEVGLKWNQWLEINKTPVQFFKNYELPDRVARKPAAAIISKDVQISPKNS